ncbi:unnamed protein product [Commensalibacter communis]|uniref:Uncharacterized protein n=1 Tax=Commensalibacter communis TaxID=2972786 RepID=A0A9W4X6Y7_9PROT|nr:hypothetical protein [Commensalibacter communis]CAI3947095.1 unnamed protein product [Commensalibacter communis]CAI3947559.1 unnamed protein product [Commensalibacter communis]
MLRNTIQDFQDKLDSLDRFDFYTHSFQRQGKPHYTETLNVDEGIKYHFGNEYSRRLLKTIVRNSEIIVKVFARPVHYEESTNTHTYETPEWFTIDGYSISCGEYPYEHFEGYNTDDEKRTAYLDDVTYFIILPTQKPNHARSYNPCSPQ